MHAHPVEDGASWRRSANGSLRLSQGQARQRLVGARPPGGPPGRRGVGAGAAGILWPLLEEEVAPDGAWAGAGLPVGGEK